MADNEHPMLNQLTISELGARLARRDASARQAMQACLDRIAAVDEKIHAFISCDVADALAQADAADRLLAKRGSGSYQPLLGVPVAIKDVLAVSQQPLNCGSKILDNFVSPYDATVVEKLKAAGAIVFGRLNMDEFAMGSSTENSAFGVTRNPWGLDRPPQTLICPREFGLDANSRRADFPSEAWLSPSRARKARRHRPKRRTPAPRRRSRVHASAPVPRYRTKCARVVPGSAVRLHRSARTPGSVRRDL